MSPLWGAAGAAAVVYLVRMQLGQHGYGKVLPALLLAAATASRSPWFGAAFTLCAVGDGLLLDKDRYFLAGLVAFLAGHLCFVVGFTRGVTASPSWVVLGVVAVAAGSLLALLLPRVDGVLRVAVPVYALGLGATVVAASMHSRLAMAGAFSFLVSDAVIAINRFRAPVPGADDVVMITYYLAILVMGSAILAA